MKICAAVSLLVLAVLAGQAAADSVVIVGAGELGPWTTTLTFSNPTEQPSSFAISTFPDGPENCFPGCPINNRQLPPHGTLSIPFKAFSDFPLNTIFVTPGEGSPLPVVTARIGNEENVCQSEPLPVIRLSSLHAGGVLSFAGVTRTEGAHSNLALGGVDSAGITQRISARVQLYSADGNLLGEKVFSNEFVNEGLQPAPAVLFVGDIAGQLGVGRIEDAQLEVTSISGEVALWGELATISQDGLAVITAGQNP